jgi:hypothetical protein
MCQSQIKHVDTTKKIKKIISYSFWCSRNEKRILLFYLNFSGILSASIKYFFFSFYQIMRRWRHILYHNICNQWDDCHRKYLHNSIQWTLLNKNLDWLHFEAIGINETDLLFFSLIITEALLLWAWHSGLTNIKLLII